MRFFSYILILLALFSCGNEVSQPAPEGPKGNLFIIGGGNRSPELMKELVSLADLDNGYAVVMAQSSIEPYTSFFYVSKQLGEHSKSPVIHLDSLALTRMPLDSVREANLIYLTGGNQSRFLEKVPEEWKAAIKEGYRQGATVAGTSAGAALMSELMITGDQYFEPDYEPTYSRLMYGNAKTEKGLGLLEGVVVDQHFVTRSRYNRILSVMADHEVSYGAGIEESTALIVLPHACKVYGDGQVLIFEKPESFDRRGDVIGFRNMNLNAYLQGDTVQLKNSEK
jgi:cyanophycinase